MSASQIFSLHLSPKNAYLKDTAILLSIISPCKSKGCKIIGDERLRFEKRIDISAGLQAAQNSFQVHAIILKV